MVTPKRIGIIEDNLDYLASLLEILKPVSEFQVTHWNSAESFWSSAPDRELDLLVLDLGLPGMSGLEFLKMYHIEENRKTLVLSSIQTDDKIFGALRNGAVGYLWKSEVTSLIETINTVLDGGSVMSPSIATRVLLSFRKNEENKKNDSMSRMKQLTRREREILNLVIEGESPQEIAISFGTSVGTVRQQIKSIYKKLQVNTRIQMLKKARDSGIF
jgi:DNA-binding NarL/FixJ family response regulator